VTHRDGTGWNTLELQALYLPLAGDFGDGRHTITLGLHRNTYELRSWVNNASDWRSVETTLSQRYQGDSEVNALYVQDQWQMSDDLQLTIGLRSERYETTDGEQLVRVASCTAGDHVTCVNNGDGTSNKIVSYDSRTLSGNSPKLSLAWSARDDLLLKASYGRGVRFPNVEELYNGTVTATSVTTSDPNLKAERADDIELSAERFWDTQSLRVALFHNLVQDAILRQSNTTVTPTVTNVSNVDKVRTYGLELVWKVQDLASVRGLNLDANAALTDSKVLENAKDPASVGKYWLRVPKTRGNLILSYRPDEHWLGSIGWRHQGRAYNDTYNLDVNPDVYGGVSSVNELDLRVAYQMQKTWEFALGMDNVTDERSYQAHPYPGRTLFAEVRATM
jgi:iron complex outermembrane receptor protein